MVAGLGPMLKMFAAGAALNWKLFGAAVGALKENGPDEAVGADAGSPKLVVLKGLFGALNANEEPIQKMKNS